MTEFAQCNICGDKIYFVKIRKLRQCTCGMTSVDWSLYADGYRVIGDKKNYILGND